MPKVSVIIPAYNCEAYIAQAIQSVLDQSHRDLEIIVVDDGSSDNTLQALAPYLERIQLLRQNNSGVAMARNAGLRAARGELLAFLDADDWWEPQRISMQLAALELFPHASMVFSDFAVADQTGKILMSRGIRWKYGSLGDAHATPWMKLYSDSISIKWGGSGPTQTEVTAYYGHILPWLFRGNFINTCTVMMKCETLEQVGEFDQTLQTEEDYDYWLRMAQNGSCIYVDSPLVTFRLSPGQLTRPATTERVARNILVVIQRTGAVMSSHLDPQEIISRLAQLNLRLGIIVLRAGRASEARSFLKTSLHYRPRRGMTWMLYMFTFLPAQVFTAILRLRAKLR